MLKVNNRNTRARREISSKLTIKTPKRRHWRRSGVFIDNFEEISHLVLVLLFLTLSKSMPAGLRPTLPFYINQSISSENQLILYSVVSMFCKHYF